MTIPHRQPKFPMFNIDSVKNIEEKQKELAKEALQEVANASTLDQVMEIKEAVSIIGIIKVNTKL